MLGRTLIRLALLAGVLFLVAGPVRATLGTGADGDRPEPRIPRPPTQGLPPQLADIVDDVSAVQRNSLAGKLGALGGGGPGAAPAAGAAGPRPFADRGSRRQIARLRRDVFDALREASSADDRVSVAAWQGVYVSGRRAAALVDLRRATRSRRGMPFRRLPIARTRLGLIRERGRWRIVAGELR